MQATDLHPIPHVRHAILIVEDDPEVASILETLCEYCGYRPILATDAKQAGAVFTTERPLCVLLDLGLPDVESGLNLLRRLRAEFAREAVIIVITGHTEREVHQDVWSAGADHVITKPLRADTLVRILEPERTGPPSVAELAPHPGALPGSVPSGRP
jgi:DNA-binding response OmpR family regulator